MPYWTAERERVGDCANELKDTRVGKPSGESAVVSAGGDGADGQSVNESVHAFPLVWSRVHHTTCSGERDNISCHRTIVN